MDKELAGYLMLIFLISGFSIMFGYMTYDLYKEKRKEKKS